jgi:hypothetical protein
MYAEVSSFLAGIIRFPSSNLFEYIYYSIVQVCAYLGIHTEIIISSSIPHDPALKAEEKVVALCKALGGTAYINPIGGTSLYNKARFAKDNMELRFLQARPAVYRQWGEAFVPWLSILDTLMFNTREDLSQMLTEYDLVDGGQHD